MSQRKNKSYQHMRDIELVVTRAKQLSYRMVNEFDMDDSLSFHERVTRLEYILSESNIKSLRYIGSVRNSLVHDVNDNRLRNRQRFIDTCNRIDIAFDRAKEKLVTRNSSTHSKAQNFNTHSKSNKKGCFIATAVYHSPTAPKVMVLREFRDQKLLTNKTGEQFVQFYYRNSPPIANFLSRHKFLSEVVRVGFIEPLVWGVRVFKR